MSPYQLRPITEDEYVAFCRCFARAFGKDYDADEAQLERGLIDLPRTLAVIHERDGVVGTALSFGREFSVPGGLLPAAHVTAVGVAGTHRRRGLLSRLMRRQLTDLHATGTEPVAILWPSEEAIYGRYGYGPASSAVAYSAHTRELTVLSGPPDGQLREVELAEFIDTVAGILDAARRDRPGYSARPMQWWRYWSADLESWRRGRSRLRTVLHEGPDGPDGYALFRIRRDGDDSGPQHVVNVEELVAADLAAYRQLWQYVCSIDLSRRVEYSLAAVDEPLQYLVTERRRLSARTSDGLWLRILDLPAALTGRRYAAGVDVVLDITDDLLSDNAGRWRLRAEAGAPAHCERTEAPADLVLDIDRLSAVYLGGTPLAALAAAGHVTEQRPGAVAAASTAFGWHRAPVSIESF